MGKYLSTDLDDYSELYLFKNRMKREDFNGHKYQLWMSEMRRKFKSEYKIEHIDHILKLHEKQFAIWLESECKPF